MLRDRPARDRHQRQWLRLLVAVVGAGSMLVGAGLLLTDVLDGVNASGGQVAAEPAPVRLELPVRGATAPVVPVTTGADGSMIIPEPPSTVGWWSPSALPGGARGTTVIVGHIDSRTYGIGVLAVLRSVKIGEPVVLHGVDGRIVQYRVIAVEQYLKADLPKDIFAVGGPPRLILITCGGPFDRATRQYRDNLVVRAEPL